MSRQEVNEAEKEKIAVEHGVESLESFRALVRDEMKKAFAEGSMDRSMSNSYGVNRSGR